MSSSEAWRAISFGVNVQVDASPPILLPPRVLWRWWASRKSLSTRPRTRSTHAVGREWHTWRRERRHAAWRRKGHALSWRASRSGRREGRHTAWWWEGHTLRHRERGHSSPSGCRTISTYELEWRIEGYSRPGGPPGKPPGGGGIPGGI